MTSETGVAPVVPAAIVAGVKAQLLFVSVVSVGAKVQAKVTGVVNDGVPAGVVGVAVKL
jgi:hypothetical protein